MASTNPLFATFDQRLHTVYFQILADLYIDRQRFFAAALERILWLLLVAVVVILEEC